MALLRTTETAPHWTSPSVLFLILVNLIPLVGVLAFGWNIGLIVLLYWMETVVIGLVNVPKILTAKRGTVVGTGESQTRREVGMGGRIFLALFFMVHFGGFNAGHYFFLDSSFDLPPIDRAAWLAAGGMALSHVFSMLYNWFGKREFERSDPNLQMFKPYGRIVVMHLVIIVGGFLVLVFNDGLGFLLLLIGLKTVVDVVSHRVAHSFAQGWEAQQAEQAERLDAAFRPPR